MYAKVIENRGVPILIQLTIHSSDFSQLRPAFCKMLNVFMISAVCSESANLQISDAPSGADADGDGTPDYLDTSPWNQNIGKDVDFFCRAFSSPFVYLA